MTDAITGLILKEISKPIIEWVKDNLILEKWKEYIVFPDRRDLPEKHPPSILLRAEYAVVPFTGRDNLITKLHRNWINSADKISIKLIHAPGGEGKTRFGIEQFFRSKFQVIFYYEDLNLNLLFDMLLLNLLINGLYHPF